MPDTDENDEEDMIYMAKKNLLTPPHRNQDIDGSEDEEGEESDENRGPFGTLNLQPVHFIMRVTTILILLERRRCFGFVDGAEESATN